MPQGSCIPPGNCPIIAEQVRQDKLGRAGAVIGCEPGAAAEKIQKAPKQCPGAVQSTGDPGAGAVQYGGWPVFSPDLAQAAGGELQRFVPTGCAELARTARSVPNQWAEQAVGCIGLLWQGETARAAFQVLAARRVIDHASHASVFNGRQQRAGIPAAILAAKYR